MKRYILMLCMALCSLMTWAQTQPIQVEVCDIHRNIHDNQGFINICATQDLGDYTALQFDVKLPKWTFYNDEKGFDLDQSIFDDDDDHEIIIKSTYGKDYRRFRVFVFSGTAKKFRKGVDRPSIISFRYTTTGCEELGGFNVEFSEVKVVAIGGKKIVVPDPYVQKGAITVLEAEDLGDVLPLKVCGKTVTTERTFINLKEDGMVQLTDYNVDEGYYRLTINGADSGKEPLIETTGPVNQLDIETTGSVRYDALGGSTALDLSRADNVSIRGYKDQYNECALTLTGDGDYVVKTGNVTLTSANKDYVFTLTAHNTGNGNAFGSMNSSTTTLTNTAELVLDADGKGAAFRRNFYYTETGEPLVLPAQMQEAHGYRYDATKRSFLDAEGNLAKNVALAARGDVYPIEIEGKRLYSLRKKVFYGDGSIEVEALPARVYNIKMSNVNLTTEGLADIIRVTEEVNQVNIIVDGPNSITTSHGGIDLSKAKATFIRPAGESWIDMLMVTAMDSVPALLQARNLDLEALEHTCGYGFQNDYGTCIRAEGAVKMKGNSAEGCNLVVGLVGETPMEVVGGVYRTDVIEQSGYYQTQMAGRYNYFVHHRNEKVHTMNFLPGREYDVTLGSKVGIRLNEYNTDELFEGKLQFIPREETAQYLEDNYPEEFNEGDGPAEPVWHEGYDFDGLIVLNNYVDQKTELYLDYLNATTGNFGIIYNGDCFLGGIESRAMGELTFYNDGHDRLTTEYISFNGTRLETFGGDISVIYNDADVPALECVNGRGAALVTKDTRLHIQNASGSAVGGIRAFVIADDTHHLDLYNEFNASRRTFINPADETTSKTVTIGDGAPMTGYFAGDVTGDGNITIGDATVLIDLLKMALADRQERNAVRSQANVKTGASLLERADVDGDDELTQADVDAIVSIINHLSTSKFVNTTK